MLSNWLITLKIEEINIIVFYLIIHMNLFFLYYKHGRSAMEANEAIASLLKRQV